MIYPMRCTGRPADESARRVVCRRPAWENTREEVENQTRFKLHLVIY